MVLSIFVVDHMALYLHGTLTMGVFHSASERVFYFSVMACISCSTYFNVCFVRTYLIYRNPPCLQLGPPAMVFMDDSSSSRDSAGEHGANVHRELFHGQLLGLYLWIIL